MISENTLELLEYQKLLRILAEPAHCPATRQAVLELRPSGDLDGILQRQYLVGELRRMTAEGNPLRILPFSDLKPFLDKARPQGAVLDSIELSAFIPFLRLSRDLSRQIRETEAFPELKNLIQTLKGFPDRKFHFFICMIPF